MKDLKLKQAMENIDKRIKRPPCKKCDYKKVDLINQYAMIGPYLWFGVHCHGEFGRLYYPLHHGNFNYFSRAMEDTINLGMAFDDENKQWQGEDMIEHESRHKDILAEYIKDNHMAIVSRSSEIDGMKKVRKD